MATASGKRTTTAAKASTSGSKGRANTSGSKGRADASSSKSAEDEPGAKAKKAGKKAGKKTAKRAASKKASAKPAVRAVDDLDEIIEDDDELPTKGRKANGSGRQLVIVESPAKAKTINKYLGSDFVVHASVGHIRDLPEKAPKGVKQPVPGVDLEHDFQPTYVVLPGKAKTVAELKRLAKEAPEVWFATDLDREGEAIAWHLAQVLNIEPSRAKRVVFNAITKAEVQKAFNNPHPIDQNKVNAQQARRILDRIVGYRASPLLWKKVARGLSAGRVQSVAVRIIVEREREIRAFVPDEYWKFTAQLALDPSQAPALAKAWDTLADSKDDRNKGPTLKTKNAWLAEHGGLKAELVELDGSRFELGAPAAEPKDLSAEVKAIAEAVGLAGVAVDTVEDPSGKGPARYVRTVRGRVDFDTRYKVRSIETRRTSSKPSPPFITSSLQIAAANQLGFSAQRTMRTAQSLYEGVEIPGEGQVGLITYMRTDSTNIAPEALEEARTFVGKLGKDYLPDEPNRWSSSNKDAQEAHEAIRPTAVARHPDNLVKALTPDQHKLYDLIWRRFVAGQMTPAQWDATTVLFERENHKRRAVLKATGRVLVFDGFYKVAGVPTASDEQTLPDLQEGKQLAPFTIDADQKFTSPPPRYTEASLVKTLESEGIGRPSTYASIISVIQDRKYVEQVERRFYATDLGEVVTDKLIEAFPSLMDVNYTRQMEAELDKVEDQTANWVAMLRTFYGPFSEALDNAHEAMTHAKAEQQPALYKCPQCGSRTVYRFGRNGRFLSCSSYPDCEYSAPIDREGRPLLPERVDVACPEDGSEMELRNGRFGPFLASVNYPATTYVINLDKNGGLKYPTPPPFKTSIKCPKCDADLNLRRGKRGPWLGCSRFPKCRGRVGWNSVDEGDREALEKELEKHEKEHPVPQIRTLSGEIIPEGTPVVSLIIPGGVAELQIHPEAAKELGKGGSSSTVQAQA